MQNRRAQMRNRVLWLLAALTVMPIGAFAQIWTFAAIDALGDGRDPSQADAPQLSYRFDKQKDMLWFRISLYNAPKFENLKVKFIVNSASEKPIIRDARLEGNAVIVAIARPELSENMK